MLLNMLQRQRHWVSIAIMEVSIPITIRSITRTGLVNNHYLAFSGGTPQSNYRASFGVMDHNTIIKKMDYNVFVAKS